jgi:hypothetical protein
VLAAEDGDTAAPMVVVEEDFHFQWWWRKIFIFCGSGGFLFKQQD